MLKRKLVNHHRCVVTGDGDPTHAHARDLRTGRCALAALYDRAIWGRLGGPRFENSRGASQRRQREFAFYDDVSDVAPLLSACVPLHHSPRDGASPAASLPPRGRRPAPTSWEGLYCASPPSRQATF